MVWGIFKKDSVSEAYKKMLKGKQAKLDVNKNGRIDGDDLAKLRNEDYEDETAITPADAAKAKKPTNKKKEPITPNDVKEDYEDETAITPADAKKKKKKEVKEDVEQLDEYESQGGVYKHAAKPGRYGGSEKESDYVKGPSDAALKKIEAEKKKKKNEDFEIFNEKELDMLINEVLSKNASAGEWIADFIKSDNPKFAGKSKEERKKMALGA